MLKYISYFKFLPNLTLLLNSEFKRFTWKSIEFPKKYLKVMKLKG
jgi:hypothetical protein